MASSKSRVELEHLSMILRLSERVRSVLPARDDQCLHLFFQFSLMEQTPTQMGEEAVRWAKLIIPLVVHSAHKVQLRGATALEMGMPLLLQKQQEVAAVTEHLMTTVSRDGLFFFSLDTAGVVVRVFFCFIVLSSSFLLPLSVESNLMTAIVTKKIIQQQG